MKVSLQGFNETIATLACLNKLKEGCPVKLSANATVVPCAEDDLFCGVVVQGEEHYAGVQLGGYAKLKYSGTAPTVGYQSLAADYNNGVKTVSTGGRSLLVVDVDSTTRTIGLILG